MTEKGEIDFVVVREGTEGLYCGNGGVVRSGTPAEIATEVSINTAYGVERVVRDAFERATRRRNKVTLVHKHNVLVNAGGLWQRIFAAVAAEYPQVSTDYLHVDAATIFLVQDPARFDVIVTDNLFGDILTDLAAAVTGGIGLAASGNINPTGAFPSMFEPVHGSAPDIAGQQHRRPDGHDLVRCSAAGSSRSLRRGRPGGEGGVERHRRTHRRTPDERGRRRHRGRGLGSSDRGDDAHREGGFPPWQNLTEVQDQDCSTRG